MYNSPGPSPTAQLFPIPAGHAGIEVTVRHMRRLSRAGAKLPEVVTVARRIVGAHTGAAGADRIRRFLADRVVFTFDPHGVELIRTPAFMLQTIQATGTVDGDCDDVAVLGAALGLAVGMRARYILVGLTPGEPYEHVYAELLTRDGAVELDTTRPAQMPPGVTVHRTGIREA